ncbi:hypothetical protein FOZG_17744 [Fusarium oxysporum Fo47]|uniref:Nephrocystin 3-like N-terminal domain-containing protein n=1 Tax=Fusarium oxysporum Fo47 TaxID=660027 RepID=W9J9J1_FUSOX|nr:hypothetical protein FOZG_17744 [Fusarium oxysporum Fo47]
MAVLPDGEYGTDSAASVATNMLGSFPNVRIGLLVGIGGGAPSGKHDIRLGDIVVTAPRDGEGGVFQYDFGKTVQDQVFQNTRFLDQPPRILRTALTGIQAQYKRKGHQLEQMIDAVLKNPRLQQGYQRPPPDTDRLFQADFIHDPRGCAEFCVVNPTNLVPRRQRTEHEDNPAIHYGTIASANQLMKDAFIRNKIASEKGVLCFEMEAAGLMNHFPCLVIRGICDYSDSHKNKEWQGYAALAAAAYAKALLLQILPDNVKAEKRINELLSSEEVQSLRTTIHDVGQKTVLNRLPVAAGACFNSHAEEHNPTCLPNTRVDLLHQIHDWANDPCAEAIFWLNGMAGTGKSTISRTVARDFAKSGHLGASFFFKRRETDRGNLAKFVPTLARQLAWSIPGVAPFIKKGIDADPDIVGKAVREQFEKLIREPLSRAVATPSTPLSVVMVIDALDECDQEADIRLLINIFSLAKTLRPHLRVFLTSRPELPIRLGFGEVQGSYQDLVLHDISAQVVEHDIIVFLDDEFKKIRHDFNMTVGDERKLRPDWPGRPIVQSLARMAVPLFIFAATVCRFVGDRKRDSPPMQLRKVLDYEIKGHVSQLGRTYGPVLRSLITDVSENDKTQIINDFKMIVGSIVILANPLSVWALSQLLEVDPEVVDNRLDTLHSVLSIPSTRKAPVRLLHLSFRDYLLTSESELRVDERHTHQTLAKHCLRVMRGGLRENICGLSFPGTRRSTVDRSELEERIPPHLQYACMHWVYHHIEGYPKLNDDNKVYDFLTTHFLHWLELMSLMGRSTKSLRMLKSFRDWLEHDQSPNLSSFVADAVRFVQTNISVIDEAPLQLYSSALVFSPSNSVVGGLFKIRIPKWLSLWPHVEENWDACLSTLEGHSDDVYSVVFSHDSKVVASASGDNTVRLWSVETGKCKHVLEGHGSSVLSVVFSHDSKAVASGSGDNTVRLWSVETGECKHVLKGHGDSVFSVVFSHDSKIVASASFDYTVRLWSVETGKCEHVLEDHGDVVDSVVFSHDSKVVASASRDNTVRLWSVETGECKHVLKGHGSLVVSVVFSHDSKVVASASLERTIRLWSVETGECKHVLKGHVGLVHSIVFSHDSKVVASASDDNTVRLWSVETGQCARVIQHTSRTWEFYVEASRMWTFYFTADNTSLVTDTGLLSVTYVPTTHTQSPILSSSPSIPEFDIDSDISWILYGGKELFRLPTECRHGRIAISGNNVVVGCDSGRVVVLSFSLSGLRRLAK